MGKGGRAFSGLEAGPAPKYDYQCVGGCWAGQEFCKASLCTFRWVNIPNAGRAPGLFFHQP